MIKKLSVKEHKFVAGIIKGLSATQSAKDAGYSESNAHNVGSKLLKEDYINREIERQLNVAGFSPERILAELWDLYSESKANGSYGPAKDILVLLGRNINMFQDVRKTQSTVTHQFEQLLDATNKTKDITPPTPVIPTLRED